MRILMVELFPDWMSAAEIVRALADRFAGADGRVPPGLNFKIGKYGPFNAAAVIEVQDGQRNTQKVEGKTR